MKLPISRTELLAFLRSHRYAVEASSAPDTGVQAAVVGFAITDDFCIVFDTVEGSRKARNLARDPRIALVIGGTGDDDDRTVQYEGVAERLQSVDMRVVEELYFRKFPDGRDRLSWEGIMHLRVRPQWMRYSDFRLSPPLVVELNATQIAALE